MPQLLEREPQQNIEDGNALDLQEIIVPTISDLDQESEYIKSLSPEEQKEEIQKYYENQNKVDKVMQLLGGLIEMSKYINPNKSNDLTDKNQRHLGKIYDIIKKYQDHEWKSNKVVVAVLSRYDNIRNIIEEEFLEKGINLDEKVKEYSEEDNISKN